MKAEPLDQFPSVIVVFPNVTPVRVAAIVGLEKCTWHVQINSVIIIFFLQCFEFQFIAKYHSVGILILDSDCLWQLVDLIEEALFFSFWVLCFFLHDVGLVIGCLIFLFELFPCKFSLVFSNNIYAVIFNIWCPE